MSGEVTSCKWFTEFHIDDMSTEDNENIKKAIK